MAKKESTLILPIIEEPYNPTDPKVKIDPEFDKKNIVKVLDDPDYNASSGTFSSLKNDAINIPIVHLNNIVVDDNQIDQVVIYFNDFFPTIHLSIKDTSNVIQLCDTPGFDNEIHVEIICQLDGYYKKIDLLFYITEVNVYDEYLAYEGIYKMQSLNSHMIKQIGKGKLNTYQMLYEIAKENKLGFAATKNCEEIKDERYRLIQSKTYVDYINDQLSFSGLDENSIFDAWIDLFGYIVMVNVSYVLNDNNVKQEQLTCYAIYGGDNTINDESTYPNAILAQRTLTNKTTDVTNINLRFTDFETYIDNNTIYQDGSLNTNWYMTSPCDGNKIENEQLQLIENSVDGVNYSNQYEYGKIEFLGVDFGDLPIISQKKLNKRFFDKIRAKQIRIELERYNLGLERGTLVNILWTTNELEHIRTFLDDDEVTESIDGKIDPYLTDMYYIDGIKFEYIVEEKRIKQYLYLIKKGSQDKPINKHPSEEKQEKFKNL